jgi:LacI family transcriptional regulator
MTSLPGSKVTNPRKAAATITSIAASLSLSPSTVSRALRGESAVHPETTQRIREAARQMGYRRDYRGVNLRTGRTNTLCAILSLQPMREFGDPAAMHLMQGLISSVEGSDLKLLIQPVIGEEDQLAALRDAVEAMRADGIIIDHTQPNDARVRYLIESGVPFVTFGRTELADQHAFFDIDNEHAASMATSRLAHVGHHRIALIDPPTHFLFSAQRRRGYLRALEAANLPTDLSLLVETPINAENVAAATVSLMSLPDPPTAFVLSNEVATLAAIKACRTLGVDLSQIDFVSRDGTHFFDFFEPKVSSCYYPQIEAGKALSSMLIEAIGGAPPDSLQRVVRTEFISR